MLSCFYCTKTNSYTVTIFRTSTDNKNLIIVDSSRDVDVNGVSILSFKSVYALTEGMKPYSDIEQLNHVFKIIPTWLTRQI